MSLYGFITPVDFIEENDNDENAPPITVPELKEWHADSIICDAKYTPWEPDYGITRSTRDLQELQEQCVRDDTTCMHSPWDEKPVLVATVENKAAALRRTENSRNLLRQDAM